MRRSIILPILLVGAAALGIAACGSGGDSGGSAARSSTGVVSVANVGSADVLADSAGKTLYTAAVEKGGMVRCVGACTSFWKPVPGSSADAKQAAGEVDAKFGVVKRPDGLQQLTFDGLPLYTFAQEGAGKLTGDGFADDFKGTHFQWQAARTSGAAPSSQASDKSSGYGY